MSTIKNQDVAAAFRAYPAPVRAKLMKLRQMILDTAAKTDGVGKLDETLKWRQPSYLPAQSKSGTTIRVDQVKDAPKYALYFHCQTNLVETFRRLYPDDMSYVGNRSIEFALDDKVPDKALRHCIVLALTYHRRNRTK
ncbi:MAG: DUF1801 domain-containing protein [Rhodospirillales bacterium]